MLNDFTKWSTKKQKINDSKVNFQFRQKDIFFMSIGKNIGFEQSGHGDDFKRPVLVYKKFNKFVFLGIPLTSKPKHDKFHFEFEYKKGTKSFAILSQIRLFDMRRALYHDGKISKIKFEEMQKSLLDLIVTPFQKERVCTKAICKEIISKDISNVKSNILITGSNGQLGSELQRLNDRFAMLNYRSFFTTSQELDITDFDLVKKYTIDNQIKIIINCAAYTAVDKAQSQQELADKINHLAVKNLALISKENGIKLIHISTDYVFDGTNFKPYTEDDTTNPQSVYGQTKLDGEKALIETNPLNSIIIRTSWVYSSFGNNFVKTMLKLGKEKESLGVIFDQVGTPTYAADLAKAILDILPQINNSNVEIYNYSNEGVLSWYDFAKEIMKMAKIDCIINPIETLQYPTPAKRPHYSLLNKSKIKKEFGIIIPYWKDSLDTCLKELGELDG